MTFCFNTLILFILLNNTNCDAGCSCNLLNSYCDINCCCDPDCSSSTKQTFSHCIEPNASNYLNLCEYNSTNMFSTSYYCLLSDTLLSKNTFKLSLSISSNADFDSIIENIEPIYTSNSHSQHSDLHTYYQGGDNVLITYNNGLNDYLRLPQDSLQYDCDEFATVSFLNPVDSLCHRYLTNLVAPMDGSTPCSLFPSIFGLSNASIGLGTFDILSGNSPSSNRITPVISCLDAETFEAIPCPVSTPTNAAVGSGFVCINVPIKIDFIIAYSRTGGLTAMSIVATVGAVTATFDQHFSLKFVQTIAGLSAAPMAEPKRGNPGYNMGSPVIAGHTNITHISKPDSAILQVERVLPSIDSNIDKVYGVWSVLSGGVCDLLATSSTSQRFQPISFGYDLYTGFRFSIDQSFLDDYIGDNGVKLIDRCIALQSKIAMHLQNSADGSTSPAQSALFPDRIAIWPASLDNISSDWVTIVGRDSLMKPTNPEASGSKCSNIILGLDIVIQFANFGKLTNPVRRIVGVSMDVIRGSLVIETRKHDVEITTRVHFVDVSHKPTLFYKLLYSPVLSLPSNFFYPFFMDQ